MCSDASLMLLTRKVLKNGVEVKLQRNALSVLEHPTGNEVDEDNDFDTSSGSDIGEKDHDFCTVTWWNHWFSLPYLFIKLLAVLTLINLGQLAAVSSIKLISQEFVQRGHAFH